MDRLSQRYVTFDSLKYVSHIKTTIGQEISVENLKQFVRQNSNVYIGLEGCLQEFDVLAQQFAAEVGEQAETIIQRTENAIADIPTDDKV